MTKRNENEIAGVKAKCNSRAQASSLIYIYPSVLLQVRLLLLEKQRKKRKHK